MKPRTPRLNRPIHLKTRSVISSTLATPTDSSSPATQESATQTLELQPASAIDHSHLEDSLAPIGRYYYASE
ncbi:hypothetical protein MTO96_011462 [Rhipicephalus appendiculatus]